MNRYVRVIGKLVPGEVDDRIRHAVQFTKFFGRELVLVFF